MMVHVHNNILYNINLAHVANQFVDRKDSRKQINQTFFSELLIIHIRFSFHFELDLIWKNTCKKKKVRKNSEKPWKNFGKKHKTFKAIWAVLGHLKP